MFGHTYEWIQTSPTATVNGTGTHSLSYATGIIIIIHQCFTPFYNVLNCIPCCRRDQQGWINESIHARSERWSKI